MNMLDSFLNDDAVRLNKALPDLSQSTVQSEYAYKGKKKPVPI